ncbi:hypothetical protein NFI96_024726 [Prochilodus magdalenae]|nr:hypothetical protein NFI96_024726 [Prochilodus magdalenae]
MARRVAVIGAGVSGLTCIKCCLDEGLEPVCFESSDDIGGLWKFKEKPEPGRSSVYRSLVTNTSKEMMCFSDFPMPAHYPNYMTHSQLLQYFRLYAEHFDLLKHIRFQTSVCSVKQQHDFSHSGQWEVITKSKDGHKKTHVFDAVFVCSGHFTNPVTPTFPGIDTFPGKCSHSWSYKDPDVFRGKRVVVVGIGNSGGDIAVDISREAEKTFLSMYEGAWVVGRTANGGLPMDMILLNRWNAILVQLLPRALLNWLMERAYNQKWDHRLYRLQPSHRCSITSTTSIKHTGKILDQRPIINDDLPGRILQGALQVKPNIQEFRGSTVNFDNGTVEEGIDAVVFCTGYKATFPFLDPTITNSPEGELTLFRRVFPLSLQHPTLAIIGILNPKGSIMPVVEMQARWAVTVFKGLNRLPPLAKMHEIVEADLKTKKRRHRRPRRIALEEDYIPYMDSIAQEVRVRPNLIWLFLTDPGLGWKVLFGPTTPYQYRLCGPGRWEGARHAIFSQWERVVQPLNTRPIPEPRSSGVAPWLCLTGGAVLIFAVIVLQK